jgi:serine protease
MRSVAITVLLFVAYAGAGQELAREQIVPYSLDMMRAREVWPYGRGSGVNVVMIDTGIDSRHPDLAAGIAGGINLVGDPDDFSDEFVHGTLGAGIIGARDNGFGIVGVAPECRLWAVKHFTGTKGVADPLGSSVEWILQKKRENGGNWIVTAQYVGSAQVMPSDEAAVRRLREANVVVMASAGNSALDFEGVLYPAGYPGVIGVGASDERGDVTVYSSPGAHVDVVAPGNNVVTTMALDQGWLTWIAAGGQRFFGTPMHLGFATGGSGLLIDANIGRPEDFHGREPGFIAVIRRTDALTFQQQGRNAVAAGAAGLVIMNDQPSKPFPVWTFFSNDPADRSYQWPFAIAVSLEEGTNLLAYAGTPASTKEDCCDYATGFGTSYAAPNVAGVAALLWSAVPHATAEEISQAIIETSHDVGMPGRDDRSGHGLVDARAALARLAPDTANPRRRTVRH